MTGKNKNNKQQNGKKTKASSGQNNNRSNGMVVAVSAANRINGSMSRMENPSRPRFSEVYLKQLKYFRPYDGWTVGPISGSIALAEAIGFSLSDFISQSALNSYEAVKLDRLEIFVTAQQAQLLPQIILYSSVDPQMLTSDYGSISLAEVTSRSNLQKSILTVINPEVSVASFVPVPSVNATDVPYATNVYKQKWLSVAEASNLRFNGIKIGALMINNPYTSPDDRPRIVMSARLHFGLRGKVLDTDAFMYSDINLFANKNPVSMQNISEQEEEELLM